MATKYFARSLILPMVAASGLALAQHMNSDQAPCRDKVSTVDLAECFGAAGKAADKQLNELHKEILNDLEPRDRKALRNVQRLWVQFRDATCAAERGLYADGTAAGPAYLACLEEETRLRVQDMQAIYGWRVVKFGHRVHS